MSIEEYKKKSLDELTLPSGLKVTVRNPSPYLLLKVQEDLGINITDDAYNAKLIEKLFAMYVIKPKIPDEIKVEEFLKEDYEMLHEAMFESLTFEEKEEEK